MGKEVKQACCGTCKYHNDTSGLCNVKEREVNHVVNPEQGYCIKYETHEIWNSVYLIVNDKT